MEQKRAVIDMQTVLLENSHDAHLRQQDIIGTNHLTKFHDDWKINVASRVLTRKNAPIPGSHVFQPTSIIFKLFQDIIRMNLLTKFHEDRTVNVASRVKNAPPRGSHEKCPAPGGHVFKATKTILELIQDIIGTNLLTKFHDDRKINITSRVLKRKNNPPRGGHVFLPTGIIFELVQDIIGMNLLTEFHEGWTINVASIEKNDPPLGSNTNLLTIFHEDWTINVASRKKCPLPGGHVFQPKGIIFELVQDIIEMNLLTKFHEDWTINVASRVNNLSAKLSQEGFGHHAKCLKCIK
ncbi:hypothetical protein DPMN_100346 [Dreissena polymorpha]|uniref:Uncharacterized protein n=1 Tax=Dreissena polymorpha TaxID=45954 RepID=A0A9D4LHD5_DREPO|nr:hypothetical protein DPMN_100346 [Dreissena polymorpha]